MTADIAIVDYGLGNLGSVANMFRRVGVRARISCDRRELSDARGLVLPGVGHFDEGMRNLRARGLVALLTDLVRERRRPVLGICLGVQLMARQSEEGAERGLGWLDADVRRFRLPPDASLPIPHMGWNEVEITDDVLMGRATEPARFYFVHSYHLVCDRDADVAAWCRYGVRFAAAVHAGNLYGTQFHPEKSHRHGMTILRNFADVVTDAG